jgi:hypothetical protein
MPANVAIGCVTACEQVVSAPKDWQAVARDRAVRKLARQLWHFITVEDMPAGDAYKALAWLDWPPEPRGADILEAVKPDWRREVERQRRAIKDE